MEAPLINVLNTQKMKSSISLFVQSEIIIEYQGRHARYTPFRGLISNRKIDFFINTFLKSINLPFSYDEDLFLEFRKLLILRP